MESENPENPKYLSYANVTNEIPIDDFSFNDNILITLQSIVLEIATDPSSKTELAAHSPLFK